MDGGTIQFDSVAIIIRMRPSSRISFLKLVLASFNIIASGSGTLRRIVPTTLSRR
jgi:hypothetical protein